MAPLAPPPPGSATGKYSLEEIIQILKDFQVKTLV